MIKGYRKKVSLILGKYFFNIIYISWQFIFKCILVINIFFVFIEKTGEIEE